MSGDRIELAPASGECSSLIAGDVLLEVAGAAFAAMDFHIVAVERRGRGDEPLR
jgi:hypothetical protein